MTSNWHEAAVRLAAAFREWIRTDGQLVTINYQAYKDCAELLRAMLDPENAPPQYTPAEALERLRQIEMSGKVGSD